MAACFHSWGDVSPSPQIDKYVAEEADKFGVVNLQRLGW